jgi:hypothetical protein
MPDGTPFFLIFVVVFLMIVNGVVFLRWQTSDCIVVRARNSIVDAVVMDWLPPRRPCVPARLGVAGFPGGGGPAECEPDQYLKASKA